MTAVFPVVFTKTQNGYVAHVPDFGIDTQGCDLAEAIFMARDAIGLMGIDMIDDGHELPCPSDFSAISHGNDEIVSVVDIDFDAYRHAHDRSIKAYSAAP